MPQFHISVPSYLTPVAGCRIIRGMNDKSVPVLSAEERLDRALTAIDTAQQGWLADITRIEALEKALRDLTALIPADRWPLIRGESQAVIHSVLRSEEAHRG